MFDYRPMFPELNSIRRARELRTQFEEARNAWQRRVEHYREACRNGVEEMILNRYANEAHQAFVLSEQLSRAMLGERKYEFDN